MSIRLEGCNFTRGQLTRELDRLGIQQTVVTAYLPGVPRRQDPSPCLSVHRLGIDVPWWRQMYGIPAAVVAARVARRGDVVHVHLGEDLAVLPVAMAAAVAGRCPLMVTEHCSLRHTMVGHDLRSVALRTIGVPLEAAAVRGAAAVITLTRRLAGRLADDGVPGARLHVLPSGFAPELATASTADAFPALPRPRVVFVGRLAPQKSLNTLLDAVERLTVPAELVLVGDGPERRRLEERSTGRRVTFTGFLSHDRIPAVLRSADVVVLPSVYEELGSVLVEASAVGAAIVATDTGGIPEVVVHGETGLLVPPQAPRHLTAAIEALLGDPVRRHRLGEVARRAVVLLSWPRVAHQTLQLYRSVLDGSERLAA